MCAGDSYAYVVRAAHAAANYTPFTHPGCFDVRCRPDSRSYRFISLGDLTPSSRVSSSMNRAVISFLLPRAYMSVHGTETADLAKLSETSTYLLYLKLVRGRNFSSSTPKLSSKVPRQRVPPPPTRSHQDCIYIDCCCSLSCFAVNGLRAKSINRITPYAPRPTIHPFFL